MQEPVPGIKAVPAEENPRHFHVIVDGPEDVCITNFILISASSDLSLTIIYYRFIVF